MSKELNIRITIRPKYNLFDKQLLKNPFEGELGKQYEKEALGLVGEALQKGRTNGEIPLTTCKDAVDTIYTHSKDLELYVHFSVK
tara:strand:- start:2274 stop:2528 length:255 start_codon:yes stop_codon:yes gene_type:complete